MGEQEKDFDVEGHRIAVTASGDDVEAHRDRAGDDEDVEAHRVRAGDEDDVEGHVQPPRDTDLGNAPR